MKYRRLPGKRRKLTGNSTLWMGDDHLLLIKSSRINEVYRRFYFRDIQAVTVRQTTFSFQRNMVDAILWLLLAVTFLYLTRSPVTFAMGAAVLLYKRFSGPYCVCHIQTAVQRERIPSLYKIQYASKVLSEITPLIEAAQGGRLEERLPSEPSQQTS